MMRSDSAASLAQIPDNIDKGSKSNEVDEKAKSKAGGEEPQVPPSFEELQQKRAQLLNQQQLRQSALDKKHADQRKQIQHGVQSDWEVRFARAKLELKEKHYQVSLDGKGFSCPNFMFALGILWSHQEIRSGIPC